MFSGGMEMEQWLEIGQTMQSWHTKQCVHILHKKMKFPIKDFFSKRDEISRKLRVWSHLLKKTLMELKTSFLVQWNIPSS